MLAFLGVDVLGWLVGPEMLLKNQKTVPHKHPKKPTKHVQIALKRVLAVLG